MLFVCAVAWGSRQGFHSYLWHLRNAFAAAVSDPKPHTGHCRFHCAPSIMDYPFVPPPGILEVVCCRESCVRLSIEGSLIRGWCSCRWRLRKIFVFHFSFVVFLFVSSGFSFSRGRPVISSNRSERTALDQYRTPGPVEVWSVWALGYVGALVPALVRVPSLLCFEQQLGCRCWSSFGFRLFSTVLERFRIFAVE